jgi:hypothetical protein
VSDANVGLSGTRYVRRSLEAWAWALVALERTKLRGLTPAAHYLRDRIRAGLSETPLGTEATVTIPAVDVSDDDLVRCVDRVTRFGRVPSGAQQHPYMLGVRALQDLVGVTGARQDGTGYIERRGASAAHEAKG